MCGSHSRCSYQGLCHFDMYTACRGIVVVKGSPFLFGSPYASMHRSDLHIKKEILYRTITETKCVFILHLQLPWNCACNLVRLRAKDLLNWQILLQQLNELFFKLLLVSTKLQWCVCMRACVCACVNVCVICSRSYPWECYEVKCTLRCVCACVCVTIRLNPQLSLTGLAEWTAEVYHCLLISSDSHQAIRAGHSVSGPGGTRRSGSTYLRGFKAGAHLFVSGKVK